MCLYVSCTLFCLRFLFCRLHRVVFVFMFVGMSVSIQWCSSTFSLVGVVHPLLLFRMPSLDEVPEFGKFIEKFLELCICDLVADTWDKWLRLLSVVTAKTSYILELLLAIVSGFGRVKHLFFSIRTELWLFEELEFRVCREQTFDGFNVFLLFESSEDFEIVLRFYKGSCIKQSARLFYVGAKAAQDRQSWTGRERHTRVPQTSSLPFSSDPKLYW